MKEITDSSGEVIEYELSLSDLVRLNWVDKTGTYWLPSHPDFHMLLDMSFPHLVANLAAKSKAPVLLVQRSGSSINELVTEHELNEYIMGGEYDQRLSELDLII